MENLVTGLVICPNSLFSFYPIFSLSVLFYFQTLLTRASQVQLTNSKLFSLIFILYAQFILTKAEANFIPPIVRVCKQARLRLSCFQCTRRTLGMYSFSSCLSNAAIWLPIPRLLSHTLLELFSCFEPQSRDSLSLDRDRPCLLFVPAASGHATSEANSQIYDITSV